MANSPVPTNLSNRRSACRSRFCWYSASSWPDNFSSRVVVWATHAGAPWRGRERGGAQLEARANAAAPSSTRAGGGGGAPPSCGLIDRDSPGQTDLLVSRGSFHEVEAERNGRARAGGGACGGGVTHAHGGRGAEGGGRAGARGATQRRCQDPLRAQTGAAAAAAAAGSAAAERGGY